VSAHSEVKRRRREVGAGRCARAGAVRMLLCCVPGAEHGPGARPRFGDGSATRPGRYALYFAASGYRADARCFRRVRAGRGDHVGICGNQIRQSRVRAALQRRPSPHHSEVETCTEAPPLLLKNWQTAVYQSARKFLLVWKFLEFIIMELNKKTFRKFLLVWKFLHHPS
jgi:hypothetical protein